jgi:hypothetical protein
MRSTTALNHRVLSIVSILSRLSTLALGLVALSCASGDGAHSASGPAVETERPTTPGPKPSGGTPAVPPASVADAAPAAPDAVARDTATLDEPAPVTPTPPADAAAPDASSPEPTPSPDTGPSTPPSGGPRGPFTCSLVVGIQATGDWFNGGFEKIVDDNRWELMEVHSAFINYWADAKDPIWNSKPSSRCTMNADNPDRVILVVLSLHWEIVPADVWVTQITQAMNNFKAKYSNLKNLELSTFVRSPGDKPCPLGDTFRTYDLAPADQAFAKMAAMFPDFVTVAPVVHVDSCADYNNHPPHLPAGPAASAAKKMGALYKD